MTDGADGPALGTEFAGHLIEAVIGEGGMGVVYRARNLALDRERALKVLSPNLSADARFRERFRRESRLAASIEHPNVIPVHQAGEEAGHLYLAMRLVEGSDLRQMVIGDGPLEPGAAAAVIAAVAAGLDAAHAAGLIHRDVKPANVLVGADPDAGRVYLTDFGISRRTTGGETVTGTGELVGTADFIAPEQIAGEAVDHRADVYALGAVLHFALTGQAPFPRENELATLFAHTNAPRPRPSAVREGLSPELDPVVARAMAVEPAERYGSAGELARALAAATEGAETVPLAPRGTTPPPPRRRWAWLAGAAALTAAAAVAIVLVAGGGGDDESPAPNPATGPETEAPIDVGEGPVAVAVGPERVWVAARGGSAVDGVGQGNGEPDFTVDVPHPVAVAVGFDSVWAVSRDTDSLYRLDPLEGTEPLQIPLGDGADPRDVATGGRWVWVTEAGAQEVARLDPKTNELSGRVPLGTEPRAIATGDGFVWVTNIRAASVSRIDPDGPERVGSPIPVGELPNDIAVGEGGVWVTSNLNGTVTELDSEGEIVGEPVKVGGLPRGIAANLKYVWVALGDDDSVIRLDPATRELVGEPTAVDADPSDVALGRHAAWVTSEGDSTLTRINP
jgi:streptogramin lyase/tRNA A-37 threonylcarbamoyl transferase component Bud32